MGLEVVCKRTKDVTVVEKKRFGLLPLLETSSSTEERGFPLATRSAVERYWAGEGFDEVSMNADEILSCIWERTR